MYGSQVETRKQKGFAAILLVIVVSLSLMAAMVTLGDRNWLLRQDALMVTEGVEREIAAAFCRNLALSYLATDPDFTTENAGLIPLAENNIPGLGSDMSCIISSVTNKQITTLGFPRGSTSIVATSTLITNISITNTGISIIN